MCGGTGPPLPIAWDGPGSIPACAGEPRESGSPLSIASVYPRVCGGTTLWLPLATSRLGLSPRVRGNLARWGVVGVRSGVYPRVCGGNRPPRQMHRTPLRSIPACAGEPRLPQAGTDAAQVYPRVCGGTPRPALSISPMWGLSPRVRGNRHPQLDGNFGLRSIPACAGEPATPSSSPSPAKVYPRVCGGTAGRCRRVRVIPGLSPRVRGNLLAQLDGIIAERSIPACAGEPRPSWRIRAAAKVYPRVCGGTWYRRGGTLPTAVYPRVCGGTQGPSCQSILNPVYPRVCGGTSFAMYSSTRPEGLSPRVRGNPR